MMNRIQHAWWLMAVITILSTPVFAQQATMGAPQIRIGNSFYEHFGIRWGFNGPGFFFNNGGGGAMPPFGGFDPNANANFGFGGPNFSFNFSAGQGSNRSFTSSTPMVTMMNGQVGSVYDTTIRPFVVGIVPVVGEGGNGPVRERLNRLEAGETPGRYVRATSSPLDSSNNDSVVAQTAATSSATRGDLSLAEIRRQQAAAEQTKDDELAVLIEQARGYEERGQPGQAQIYYARAEKRATGEQKRELRNKIQEMKGTPR